jgi:hypothetical protein
MKQTLSFVFGFFLIFLAMITLSAKPADAKNIQAELIKGPLPLSLLILNRVTPTINADVDCIGNGSGANGTATVQFKAYYNGIDVTNSATWTEIGAHAIIAASPTTKGLFACHNTINTQVETGSFTVEYNGKSVRGNLKVQDCGAIDQNNCKLLDRVTPPVNATVDCIGNGSGANGTSSVQFKAYDENGNDVTNSATWTVTNSPSYITASPTTKGLFICNGTVYHQLEPNTFTVQYNGRIATGNINVEDCGAFDLNNCHYFLAHTTTAVNATVDCIGNGDGTNGTPTVEFKFLHNGVDVTDLTTWTITGAPIITASSTTKGLFTCNNTINSPLETGTFTAKYDGFTVDGSIKVLDCGPLHCNAGAKKKAKTNTL